MYPICSQHDSDHGELFSDIPFLHVGRSGHQCGDGISGLYSLRHVTTDRRKLEMEFIGIDGKLVVLRGMHSYPPHTLSAHRMEFDMRHGDIA